MEAADEPLGTPMPAPVDGGTHEFVALQLSSVRPVAYDPCRPIHYVIRPEHSPVDGELILHDAFARVTAVTGLQFIYDGETDEQPSENRPPFQPDRYGDRWAPVLVTWETVEENPDFMADVAGLAGSTSMSLPGEPRTYVTGTVGLDAAAFDDILAAPDGRAVARAIVLHELGHLVGLDHVSDPSQLMFPETSTVLEYASGDLAGLVQLGKGECVPGL